MTSDISIVYDVFGTADGEPLAAVFRVMRSRPDSCPVDKAWLRERGARSFQRARDPDGKLRQQAAMVACGDRWKALAGIGAPTPVLPGDPDRMIRAKGRKATSTAIAVARLAILSGVGYGALPRALWPRIIDGISALTAKAGRTASS